MTKKYTVYHSENGQHPRRLTLRRLTQPLIACSVGSYTDGQVVQYAADRAGRGWVRRLNVRQGGVLSVLRVIYSSYIRWL